MVLVNIKWQDVNLQQLDEWEHSWPNYDHSPLVDWKWILKWPLSVYACSVCLSICAPMCMHPSVHPQPSYTIWWNYAYFGLCVFWYIDTWNESADSQSDTCSYMYDIIKLISNIVDISIVTFAAALLPAIIDWASEYHVCCFQTLVVNIAVSEQVNGKHNPNRPIFHLITKPYCICAHHLLTDRAH